MSMSSRARIVVSLLVVACCFATGVSAWGADKTGSEKTGGEKRAPRLKYGEFNPEHESVDLFAAEKAGRIKVKFIAHDSKKGRLLLTNLEAKPLNVRLPEAFAAAPALAQLGPFGQAGGRQRGNNANQGNGNQGGGNQAVGGGNGNGQGFGQGNGNGFGNGRGQGNQGFFNVLPEKVAQIKVQLVCLEHGKSEPKSTLAYRLMPLSDFSDDPALGALCKSLGRGEVDQRAAQFAAWRITSGMSYEELSKKEIVHLSGDVERTFSTAESKRGEKALEEARKQSGDKGSPSPSSTGSQAAAK